MAQIRYEDHRALAPSVYLHQQIIGYVLRYARSLTAPTSQLFIDSMCCSLPKDTIQSIIMAAVPIRLQAMQQRAIPNQIRRPIDGADEVCVDDLTRSTAFHVAYYQQVDFIANQLDNPLVQPIWQRLLLELSTEYEAVLKLSTKKDAIYKKLLELQMAFNLTEDEFQIFVFLYCSYHDTDYCVIMDHTCSQSRFSSPSKIPIPRIAIGLGWAEGRVKKCLTGEGRLMQYGLLDCAWVPIYHLHEFISGMTKEPLVDRFYTRYTGTALPIAAHTTIAPHLKVIEHLITHRKPKESINILFYGVPGTGKTEGCLSLGQHMAKDIFTINNTPSGVHGDGGPETWRFSSIRLATLQLNHANTIVVIDEADELLNGANTASNNGARPNRNTDKNIINGLLDKSPGVYFWITNYVGNIDPSTRRRFDYSVEFKNFTKVERATIWQTALTKHGLVGHFTEAELTTFAEKYEINAGGVDVALRNFKRLKIAAEREDTKDTPLTKPTKKKKRESKLEPKIVAAETKITVEELKTKLDFSPPKKTNVDLIDTILAPHLTLLTGRVPKTGSCNGVTTVPFYSLDGLNVKGELPIDTTIDILRGFVKTQGGESVGNMCEPVNNMNLLMYGPPGTGKTEFAKYLAKSLDKKLLIKRGSDLLSKWVGECEQNIKAAFQEAEREKSILFIDEADSMVAERTNAKNSWEVTQVNEFLSNMEEFKGILICATNFKKNLDSASIRRFNLKVEFDYLEAEGKVIFFKRLLGGFTNIELSDGQQYTLRKIQNLSPGDYKVVRQKYSFMPKDMVTNAILLGALQGEVDNKNGIKTSNIGF